MKKQAWTKIFMIVLWVITGFAIIFGVLYRTYGFVGSKKTVAGDNNIDGKIESIDLDVSIGDIKIVYGDAASVHYEYPEDYAPEIYWENGALSVTENYRGNITNNMANEKYSLVVTIPQNDDLKDVTISADMGNVKFKDISVTGKFDITSDMGNVELDNIVCDKFSAEVDMGNIELKNITAKTIDVMADMGNIQVDGEFDNLTGNCSMGNLEVATPNENAVIDVETDMGNCTVNGKKR